MLFGLLSECFMELNIRMVLQVHLLINSTARFKGFWYFLQSSEICSAFNLVMHILIITGSAKMEPRLLYMLGQGSAFDLHTSL